MSRPVVVIQPRKDPVKACSHATGSWTFIGDMHGMRHVAVVNAAWEEECREEPEGGKPGAGRR